MKSILHGIPAKVYSSLSESESYLLEYINNHLDQIPEMSIVKLSENANVSTATIVRMMKKIGYDGYTSFKYSLRDRQDIVDTNNQMKDIDTEIKKAIKKNENEVLKTIEMLSIGQLEDAIQKIHNAEKIYVFARGFSEMIAHELTIKLQLMGKNCENHNDPNIIKLISQKINEKELAIFISLNGETQELVEACENLTNRQVSTITLTTRVDSSLGELSDLTLIGYKGSHSLLPEFEVRSRLPLNVISRILLDSYVIRMGQDKTSFIGEKNTY
ncbi:MurR/RpiR family transcriptional regulator [Fredinandcohnia onubensis]|uniref:MurR/RpiR family transcriptional regulator n=1 Tax=Fredinandcohnia onubensis TaxID=1571209 RepID=UPI000C0BDDA4|nr:MurR/RpiR family transcriptional regulator [Fredinandcohnia onubensis]